MATIVGLGLGLPFGGQEGAAVTVLISRRATDFTSSTTSMAATGLSVPVVAGHKYIFEAILMLNDASGTEGIKIDFDASTATAGYFRCYPDDGAAGFFSLSGGYVTALATDINGTGFTNSGLAIRGTFEPAITGTLAIRAAQSSHVAGALIIYQGSYLAITEAPA